MTLTLPIVPWEVVVRRRTSLPHRLTIRGAMVGVAVVAMLLWAGMILWRMGDRRREFLTLAVEHDRGASSAVFAVTSLEWTIRSAEEEAVSLLAEASVTDDLAEAAALRRQAADQLAVARNFRPALKPAGLREAHHKRLGRKYAFACRYPYLPVWPDPLRP